LGIPLLTTELSRQLVHGELTKAQASTGFLIADIYRHGDATESAKERGDASRKALDALLSEYPPKISEAVIELCVFNRVVEWKLRREIRQVLDCVAML
jgi:hypothetical protein